MPAPHATAGRRSADRAIASGWTARISGSRSAATQQRTGGSASTAATPARTRAARAAGRERSSNSLAADRRLVRLEEPGRQQRVVQLVGVARVRPLLVHARARWRPRRARRRSPSCATGPARLHRMRPPLLERRIVQERVRPRVDDLVREHRRLGRVARDEPQLAAMDALEHGRSGPSMSIASSRQSRTVWLTSG